LCDEDIQECIQEKAYMDLATSTSRPKTIEALKDYIEKNILKKEPSMLQAIKAKGTRSEKDYDMNEPIQRNENVR
jgi:hypothetical protein